MYSTGDWHLKHERQKDNAIEIRTGNGKASEVKPKT